MHSLKDYSLNLPEQEYHDYPAWSYSIIARYAKDGFSSIATLHDKFVSTPSMEFGALFDSFITKGKATLDEYAVLDMTVPESEKSVLDALYSKTSLPFDEIPRSVFSTVTDEVGYRSNWGFDAKYKRISNYRSYYDILNSRKKIVSKADWDDALEMFRIFRTDPYLKTIFGTKNTSEIEYLYQAQFVEEYTLDSGTTVTMKIMPDLLVINHTDKTIQPVELKTSSVPAYSFGENFVKFRYDIQASLYTDILALVINKDTDYAEYVILPYLFTDISRTDKVPVTYVYDPSNGFSYTKGEKTYTYKSWQELLEEILIYEITNAKVPSYIKTDGPNDLIDILSK